MTVPELVLSASISPFTSNLFLAFLAPFTQVYRTEQGYLFDVYNMRPLANTAGFKEAATLFQRFMRSAYIDVYSTADTDPLRKRAVNFPSFNFHPLQISKYLSD
jgi:hypothetical protein